MFAQSTKFNRQDGGDAGRTRDRSAPMDFAFEKPRDPGVFGALPHKRQHIETLDGQSTWAPGPFSEPSMQAPFTHSGPMLFAHPTSAKDQDAGDVSMGMDVDMSIREDLGDIDMYSDSPAKVAPSNGSHANQDAGEDADEARNGEAPTKARTSLLSSVLRPINHNAVKRVEKQRSKTSHTRSLGKDTSGLEQDSALVLREDGAAEEEESEYSSEEEKDSSNAGVTAPTLRRRPRRRNPGGEASGNQYTLNLFGNNGQNALGVIPSSSHLQYMQDSKGKINHSELPYILLGYLQFVFNASVVGVCLYLVLMFLWTIRNDVKERMATYSSEILQEISTCTNLYLVNRCEPATRIPAMETSCLEWEHCMNRDPTVVGHAKVGAEMFAGVISGFVDELSWKTIFFLLCTMTCLVFITNSALFNIRAKHAQSHHASGMPGGSSQHYPDAGYGPSRPPQIRDFEWPPVGPGGTTGNRSVPNASEKR